MSCKMTLIHSQNGIEYIYGVYRELKIRKYIFKSTQFHINILNDCIKNKFVVSIYLDINARFYLVFDQNEIRQYPV